MHTNRLITFPRPIVVLFYLFLAVMLPSAAFAQRPATPVAEWLDQCRNNVAFKSVSLFQPATERSDLQSVVEKASLLRVAPADIEALLQEAPQALRFTIPNADGDMELELAQVEILAPGFFVSTNTENNVPYQPALHYRGAIRGNPHSVACLSITSSGLMGMVADDSGTYELGKMEDASGNYIFYKTQHLKALSPNNCFAEDESLQGDETNAPSSEDRGVGCRTVQVYFECDYKLFTDKGSNTTNVSNYVTSLFNQVATLYANENIGIVISQIYVWTSTDPYAGLNSTSSVLNSFRQTRGTSFNGQLAHFLSTRSLGGGVAYVDVICFKQYAFGVSAITTTFQTVPTYSWSVEVVTHELGHNLGSWHTHSCNWLNGALDNCVSPEGSCSPGPAPTNGGTIMSYCHLTSYGINFNNGFGSVPGARIRDKVTNATCVPQSGTAPSGLASSNVTGSTATLSWTPVSGATSYTVQYKLSTSGTWSTAGTSTAASYNLTGLSASSAYNWQVKTDCSNYSATANFTTASGGGGGGGGNTCNAPTGLGTVSIGANTVTVIWNGVSGATTYTVQYKLSSASVWTTAGSTSSVSYTLNNLTAATAYNWQVKANCSGYSSASNFTTSSSGGGTCDAPSTLNNNTIGNTYASISWNTVSNASSYTLQIKLASGNDWFTLGAVTVTSVVISGLQPNTSYNWRVKANCSGYSAIKLLTTTNNVNGDGSSSFSQPTLVETGENDNYEIYPNPAADQFNLRYWGDSTPNQQLVITDATGRVVMLENLQPVYDISRLLPGVYFVQVLEDGQKRAVRRLIKM